MLFRSDQLIAELHPLPSQTVYFTSLSYDQPYSLSPASNIPNADTHVLLLCGIANPSPLLAYAKEQYAAVHLLPFADHHYFSEADREEILAAFREIKAANKIILTTEKDASRLLLHADAWKLHEWPLWVQPVRVHFLFDTEARFQKELFAFVQSYYPPEPESSNNAPLSQPDSEQQFLKTDGPTE